jgi:hypothetical protein
MIEQSDIQLVDLCIAVPEARQETQVCCVFDWVRIGARERNCPPEALTQANASIPFDGMVPC